MYTYLFIYSIWPRAYLLRLRVDFKHGLVRLGRARGHPLVLLLQRERVHERLVDADFGHELVR